MTTEGSIKQPNVPMPSGCNATGIDKLNNKTFHRHDGKKFGHFEQSVRLCTFNLSVLRGVSSRQFDVYFS